MERSVRKCTLGGPGKKSYIASPETAIFSSHSLVSQRNWARVWAASRFAGWPLAEEITWPRVSHKQLWAKGRQTIHSQLPGVRLEAAGSLWVLWELRSSSAHSITVLSRASVVSLSCPLSTHDSSSVFPPTGVQPVFWKLQWLEALIVHKLITWPSFSLCPCERYSMLAVAQPVI